MAKQKPKRLIVKLTPEQITQLKPAFDKQLKNGNGSCVVAQVFRDGMRVGVLTVEQSERLADIIAVSPERAAKMKTRLTNSAHGG